ncbi:MAG TPA: hypothetical protein VF713_18140 [Thermoanaerobaculia bacterium]
MRQAPARAKTRREEKKRLAGAALDGLDGVDIDGLVVQTFDGKSY